MTTPLAFINYMLRPEVAKGGLGGLPTMQPNTEGHQAARRGFSKQSGRERCPPTCLSMVAATQDAAKGAA